MTDNPFAEVRIWTIALVGAVCAAGAITILFDLYLLPGWVFGLVGVGGFFALLITALWAGARKVDAASDEWYRAQSHRSGYLGYWTIVLGTVPLVLGVRYELVEPTDALVGLLLTGVAVQSFTLFLAHRSAGP